MWRGALKIGTQFGQEGAEIDALKILITIKSLVDMSDRRDPCRCIVELQPGRGIGDSPRL